MNYENNNTINYDERIQNYDIDNEARNFIINRMSNTFKEQFCFYFDYGFNYDRSFIRATEETIAIYNEEQFWLENRINNVLNNNSINDSDKLNMIDNIINNN